MEKKDDSYSTSRYLKLASRCKAIRAKYCKIRSLIGSILGKDEKADEKEETPKKAEVPKDDSDLTLMGNYEPMDEKTRAALFPETPPSYFKGKEDSMWAKTDTPSSLEGAYNKAKVKPYVKVRDFNRQGADAFEDAAPHTGYEAGIKVEF